MKVGGGEESDSLLSQGKGSYGMIIVSYQSRKKEKRLSTQVLFKSLVDARYHPWEIRARLGYGLISGQQDV